MQLDAEQIKYLDEEQKSRYSTLERFFAHPGWSLIKSLANDMAETNHNKAANAQSWDENRYARGARDAAQYFSTLDERTEADFSVASQSNKDTQAVEDEENFE